MWGSARREVRVWRASLASLKLRAAVLLEPTIAACILRFLIISWRHVMTSKAMNMAQAARSATPLVSMAIRVSLRLMERLAKVAWGVSPSSGTKLTSGPSGTPLNEVAFRCGLAFVVDAGELEELGGDAEAFVVGGVDVDLEAELVVLGHEADDAGGGGEAVEVADGEGALVVDLLEDLGGAALLAGADEQDVAAGDVARRGVVADG